MRKIARIILVIIILCTVVILLPCISHGTPPEQEFGHQLTIMTYNTHRLQETLKPAQNDVLKHICRQDPDIVCMQEVEVRKSSKCITLPELRVQMKQYPYSYYDFKVHNQYRQYGNVVFSKYPLINKHSIPYQTRIGNISSRCDVVVGDDTLRLFVNHLESNALTNDDLHIPDSLTSESIKESAHRISKKLELARPIRNEQARIIHKEIADSRYPVLVVGDFNSMPLSYTYWRMRTLLRDAFLETSWLRWGATFVKHHIGIRIDYILCSRCLTPTRCWVDEVNYSDHYPVSATIAWD